MTLLFFVNEQIYRRERQLMLSLAKSMTQIEGVQVFVDGDVTDTLIVGLKAVSHVDAIRICRMETTISIFPDELSLPFRDVIANPLSWSFREAGGGSSDLVQTQNVLCGTQERVSDFEVKRANPKGLVVSDKADESLPGAVVVDPKLSSKDLRVLLKCASEFHCFLSKNSQAFEALILGCSLRGPCIDVELQMFMSTESAPESQVMQYEKACRELKRMGEVILSLPLKTLELSPVEESTVLGQDEAVREENQEMEIYFSRQMTLPHNRFIHFISKSLVLTLGLLIWYIFFVLSVKTYRWLKRANESRP